MRDNGSTPVEIGRRGSGTPDYSSGQINGIAVKKGDILQPDEIHHLLDYFSFSDDI
jgi:hypothetical protein